MGNPKFKEQMARIGVLHGENPVMANCLVVTSYEPGASDCAHAGGGVGRSSRTRRGKKWEGGTFRRLGSEEGHS